MNATQPIRYAVLNWSVQPLSEVELQKRGGHELRSRVNYPGREYLLVHYEQYRDLHHCDLCNSSQKANHVVKLIDAVTGEVLHSGLECLEKNFGIDEKAIKSVTGVQVAFLARIRDVTSKSINSTLDGLTVLRDTLKSFASGNAPALEDAVRRVQTMIDDSTGFGRGKYNDDFVILSKMFLFHYERINQKQLYVARWTALNFHPLLDGQDMSSFNTVFREPEKYLFFNQAKDIFAKLDAVSGKSVTFRGAVKPWQYPTRDAYADALRRYYEQRADDGSLDPNIIATKGNALMHYDQGFSDDSTVIAVDEFAFIPAKFASEADIARLKKKYTGLEAYLSPSSHRLTDRKKEIHYRPLVIWIPARWLTSYPLWHQHTRETLERFA